MSRKKPKGTKKPDDQNNPLDPKIDLPIAVELGPLGVYQIIALLNAAAVGSLVVTSDLNDVPPQTMMSLIMQAKTALHLIGPERWMALTAHISKATQAALNANGVTFIKMVRQDELPPPPPKPDPTVQ